MVLQSDFVFTVLVMACYTVNYMLNIPVANKQHLQHFTWYVSQKNRGFCIF